MQMLSYRGYWRRRNEQNAKIASERSLQLRFGIETGIRDFDGTLVISHDPPYGWCMSVRENSKITRFSLMLRHLTKFQTIF